MTHSGLPDAEACASHEQGWTHYLGRLAVAAAGGDPGCDPSAQGVIRGQGGAYNEKLVDVGVAVLAFIDETWVKTKMTRQRGG